MFKCMRVGRETLRARGGNAVGRRRVQARDRRGSARSSPHIGTTFENPTHAHEDCCADSASSASKSTTPWYFSFNSRIFRFNFFLRAFPSRPEALRS
jgi:hypothetical protein